MLDTSTWDWDAIAAVVQAVATIVLVVITFGYAKSTRRQASSTIETSRNAWLPVVVPTNLDAVMSPQGAQPRLPIARVRVHNQGAGPALGVTMHLVEWRGSTPVRVTQDRGIPPLAVDDSRPSPSSVPDSIRFVGDSGHPDYDRWSSVASSSTVDIVWGIRIDYMDVFGRRFSVTQVAGDDCTFALSEVQSP